MRLNPDTVKIVMVLVLLFLLLLVTALTVEDRIEVTYKPITDDACFTRDELHFDCEYTNNGNLIPFIKYNQKYWHCTTTGYEVRAC